MTAYCLGRCCFREVLSLVYNHRALWVCEAAEYVF